MGDALKLIASPAVAEHGADVGESAWTVVWVFEKPLLNPR
jgi:hypothetical protein